MRPLISVCIPTFNSEKYIIECLQSVLNQTYTEFEIIISDNDSSDDTLNLIESFKDERIKIFKNEKNIGMGNNFNKVCRHASGEYIKLLPSDDTLTPDSLEKSVEPYIINDDVSLVMTAKSLVNSNSKILIEKVSFFSQGKHKSLDVTNKILKSGRNPLGEPGLALFKKSDFVKVGGFNHNLTLVIDLDFWIKILNIGKLYFIDEPLATFRIHQNSFSLNKKAVRDYTLWIQNLESPHLNKYNRPLILLKIRVINFIKQVIYLFLNYF